MNDETRTPDTDRPEDPATLECPEYRAAVEARAVSPYTLAEKIKRVLWNYAGQILMKCTFHNWYGVRNTLLRAFGASIGKKVRIRPSVTVEQPWNLTIGNNSSVGDHVILYCLGKVTIGSNVSISQYAHLCAGTHDYNAPDMPLLRPPIVLKDNVWIAADAFVGPNVTVGEGSVLGARSSIYKSIPGGGVYAGNPARLVKQRELDAPQITKHPI